MLKDPPKMKKYQVCILVVIYNPVWEKLETTLWSVLSQKDISFQIIIADDGSEKSCEDRVKQLMDYAHFSDYFYTRSEKNNGTVVNILNGLSICEAEYVKTLGQSDLLYSEYTIKSLFEYALLNGFDATAGLYKCYTYENNNWCKMRLISRRRLPQQYTALKNSEKAIKTFILGQDSINGSTLFARRDVLNHYLLAMKGKIILCEDDCFRFMLLDRLRVGFCPFPISYYEIDTGVSNSSNITVSERMRKDSFACYTIAIEKATGDKRLQFSLEKRRKMIENRTKLTTLRWLMSDVQVFSSWVRFKYFPVMTDDVFENNFLQYCANCMEERNNISK